MIIEPTQTEQIFIDAYFEAVYFTDGGPDNPLEDPELSAYDIRRGTIDCLAFYQANEHLIGDAPTDQAGHDFWLTRNGHGTGFWDRVDVYGDYRAEQLSVNAESFGVVDVEFIES
tara:strand:+ start:116 stop:460 length:345 start_codon:yes stop_codon:yes gene_type:complete